MTEETYQRASFLRQKMAALRTYDGKLSKLYKAIQADEFDKDSISEVLSHYAQTLEALISIHEREFKDL